MKKALMWWVNGVLFVIALNLMGCATVGIPKEVSYAPRVQNSLTFLYAYIQEVEFGFCAYGHLDGDTLRVERVELALMLAASPDSMVATCEPKALGFGHSHRRALGRAQCGFSLTDIKYLANRPQTFGFVVCAGPTDDQMSITWAHKAQAKLWLKEEEK